MIQAASQRSARLRQDRLDAIDLLALTITCPRCGSDPGQRCYYGLNTAESHPHVGRAKAAGARAWWLDSHTRRMAAMQL